MKLQALIHVETKDTRQKRLKTVICEPNEVAHDAVESDIWNEMFDRGQMIENMNK